MTKRLLLLSGLAILGVVCNHATAWGFTAMFWWADRYRPVAVPNFDQLGTSTYHALLSIQQLAVFAVPAFLFVSGFFVAYAARGSASTLEWKTVLVRIRSLLVPYAIWSGVIFVGDALQGQTYTPGDYLVRLFLGRATDAYFYVPLLCQLYLLSPLLAPLAKTRGKVLLLAAGLLQLGTVGLNYCRAYGAETSALIPLIRVTTVLSFTRWSLFFCLGLVSGCHVSWIKRLLARVKWGLLIAVVVLGAAAVLEPHGRLNPAGYEFPRALHSISSQLYAVSIILCFLAFDRVAIPGSRSIHQIGRNSYGIYLLHIPVLEFSARAVRQLAPWILAHQMTLFVPLLIVVAVGIPLLLMAGAVRSPARQYHRHLFG